MDQRYKKLVAVVEFGSFSAAAKQLRVSQPAITIAIASLERSLGKKLLIRNRQTVKLTPEGEVVYASALRIREEIDSMQSLLHGDAKTPLTHVGLIDSIAHLLYASPKEKILLSNIEVMVDNSVRIINDLISGSIDFGLITGQPRPLANDITAHKLHDEQFIFVTAPTNAAVGPANTIRDWLAFNQDSTTYKHFMHQFKKKRLKVTPSFYSTSMDLLKDMAIAGNGTALLPVHFVQPALDNGLLVEVDVEPLYRPIWIITKKDGAQTTLFEPLVTKINELLAHGS